MKHPDQFDFARYPTGAFLDIIETAKRTEETLSRHGLSSLKSSRVRKYRETVEEFVSAASAAKWPDRLDWLLFHQALFEIHQLSAIVENLLKPPGLSEWLSRVHALVSGHVLPQTERENTNARDIQFELFVAACCRVAGYDVEPKEPDIFVREPDGDFVIAVKRPKSPKTLERHIRKGRNQICDSSVDGILAIDLSLIHNPQNYIQLVATKGETLEPVQSVADHFIKHNAPRIRSIVKVPNIFGIVVCMSGLFFIRSKLQFASATRWTFSNFCDAPNARYKQLRNLATRFRACA